MEEAGAQEGFSHPPRVMLLLPAPCPLKEVLLGVSCVCCDLDRSRTKWEITLPTFDPYSS